MVRRRATRVLAWFLALGVLAVVGTGGLVLLLRSLESTRPLAETCTAGDHRLEPDQTANAALVVGMTVQRGLPARAGTIGIATAMQESRMRPIDYGDRDSLGMFQQRPSQGWGTPEQVQDLVYSTSIFYDHLVEVPGYTEMAVTEAAQAVQRSAFPDAYAQHEELARAFASSLSGWSRADLSCTLHDVEDTAGVPEAVVTRLARDLAVTGTLREGPDGEREVVVDVPVEDPSSSDVDRLAWAVAHAAVAGASETGAGRVSIADKVWVRDGIDSGWRDRTAADPMPARGQVVVGS
ncbi:hypothetical protein C8046_16995 [Serinibacter arcticus]|uniref:Uncharacterized protein n=1 Tax=Serinibacter arcticus TaxID=1655435 RepID=A0A2U1ZYS3_9MICO|nr:hypothetical protein [Serinibacter arcticus]PWD52090.1 hypothetical protein C8046_16995 [Serinibacter arcticus]